MQDEASVKKAHAELSGVMGILSYFEGLGFFHVRKGVGHKPSHHAFWTTVGLWILADQRGPKAFAPSRLSSCEQKRERDREVYIYFFTLLNISI